MDRRTALATAGALAIVTVTGAAAMGANLGVLDGGTADPVGQLQPGDPELTTVVVEPATEAADPAASAGQAADADGEAEYEDDEYEDDEHEDDEDDEDDESEHEDEDDEHEYEGRDDDD